MCGKSIALRLSERGHYRVRRYFCFLCSLLHIFIGDLHGMRTKMLSLHGDDGNPAESAGFPWPWKLALWESRRDGNNITVVPWEWKKFLRDSRGYELRNVKFDSAWLKRCLCWSSNNCFLLFWNIWQSYKQEDFVTCTLCAWPPHCYKSKKVHYTIHIFDHNYAKYSPIFISFFTADSAINISQFGYWQSHHTLNM